MNPKQLLRDTTAENFLESALKVFEYQYAHCRPYRQFCDYLGRDPERVKQLEDIPFMPVELFKEHRLISDQKFAAITFRSSGTTGSVPSEHFVADPSLYELSFTLGFEKYYGSLNDYVILGLLPSYLERNDASLVYMVDRWIRASGDTRSGFYLDDLAGLRQMVFQLEAENQPYLLIGVSFALLDLAELGPLPVKKGIIMETGGMKGRRKEMIRTELHAELQKAFGPIAIHSEYGMTELLSQAYSKGAGRFTAPPWMKILTRQPNDPFHYHSGGTGGVSVIDLANYYSCSFIATQDLGRVYADGSFEILGRFDQSDLRGCNLMVL